MRRALSIAGLTLALVARAGAAEGPAKIPWAADFATALSKAGASRKPVMVEFWADWCGWCHVFERTTFSDANVIRLVQGFVAVRVDTEGSPEQARVAARYGISGLPTILFLTSGGRTIFRLPGYQGPEQFAHTLEQVRAQGTKLQTWEQAIAARPDDAAALLQLGLNALETDALEDARDLLGRAYRTDQKLPAGDRKRLRLMLGALRGVERKYTEAEVFLKEGLALTPADDQGDPQILLALGRLYSSWGKREDALSVLKRLVKEYPASAASENARQALAFLEKPS
jgi:thioredoxin-like negative regulator of GroEL